MFHNLSGEMMRSLAVLLTALTLLGVTVAPALAVEPQPLMTAINPADGNVTGGDVSHGEPLPPDPEADAKMRMAEAYVALREGSGTEASYLRAAQAYGAMSADAAAELATLPGLARESSAQVSMQSALTQQVAMALDPPASYSLAVTHYGQQNSYFCGPATGKMILKYLAAGPSKGGVRWSV